MDKVKLQLKQPTRVIELPGMPGSQIEIKGSLLLAEMTEGMHKGDQSTRTGHILAGAIVSWNFVDENDEDLPITPEVIVKSFTAQQATYIMEQIADLENATKKA